MPKRQREESLDWWPLKEREERLLPLIGFRIWPEEARIECVLNLIEEIRKKLAAEYPIAARVQNERRLQDAKLDFSLCNDLTVDPHPSRWRPVVGRRARKGTQRRMPQTGQGVRTQRCRSHPPIGAAARAGPEASSCQSARREAA